MWRELSPEEIAFGMIEDKEYVIKSRYGTYQDTYTFYGYKISQDGYNVLGFRHCIVYHINKDKYGTAFIDGGAYQVLVEE
jgi:hypothetical protein